MSLWLIRHPKPNIPSGVCYGQLDVDLLPNWEAGCERLLMSPFFSTPGLTLLSSPLKRCLSLAQCLAERHRLSVIADERLKEMHFGHWEGRRWDKIDDPHLEVWMGHYQTASASGGEGWPQLCLRVEALLTDWQSVWKDEHQALVLVTHAGVIRCIQHLLEQRSVESLFAESIPYQELIRIQH